MKIGICIDMYLPYISGVTNHVRLYKKYYEEQGHEVYIFTFGNLDYQDDEPRVFRSPAIPYRDTGWNFSPIYSAESRKLMAEMDILHAHQPFQSGLHAAFAAAKSKIPFVFTNHTRYDLYSDMYAPLIPQRPRYRTLKGYLKTFYNDCDLVIAPSASIADWMSEFAEFGEAITIPNGIRIQAFENPTGTLTREDIGLTKRDFVFLYLGRVAPEKNISFLFDEFLEFAKTSTRAKLLVVGDGPAAEFEKERLVDEALGERIILMGAKPYEELPDYAALADCFVTASISEVHPLVVLEALAAGLPVVAISSPGISDTVDHEVSGLLADAAYPSLLTEEMMRIANDANLREELSEGARTRAKDFSLENTAGRVLEQYERLVSQGRKPHKADVLLKDIRKSLQWINGD